MYNLFALFIGILGVASFVSELGTFLARHHTEEWGRTLIHRSNKGH